MAQPSRIQRTRPQVHSLLRSTVTITSIADVLTELVQNALDAEARQVDCWLSLERWSVRVQDDGHGIRLGDLRLLGERYGERSRLSPLSLNQLMRPADHSYLEGQRGRFDRQR